MGIDKIAEYGEAVGFGRKTGIDLPNEASGLMPSQKWKLRTERTKWYAGETISVAIGQGALTVTPLQLAYAIGGLSQSGAFYRPHLVKERAEQPRRVQFQSENIEKVIYGMYGVVNEYGTGGNARLPGLDVCGKTGTAQLASNEYLEDSEAPGAYEGQRLVRGIRSEAGAGDRGGGAVRNGEHGDMAAPIVRDVIKAYFDKKGRKKQVQVAQAQAARPLIRRPGDQ